VMNALAATAVAVSRGIPLQVIAAGVAGVERVAGRLEVVPGSAGFSVVVDYAHTPDALEKVLQAVRGLDPRRVVTVFGCGGDRDRGKRPLMGEIAARLSDRVVVTSDNPRTEDPMSIIEEILEGLGDIGRSQVDVIEDRRNAIRTAVAMAGDGDVVVIAGKGHEDYQIIGTEKVHFDDREEAMAAMAQSAGPAGAARQRTRGM
jgi:UDP-N-acetylmuramoyl-L-alanyl-D-glutamate--2,6-diaminopimelate ligase